MGEARVGSLGPVVKTVTVPLEQGDAFELFTSGIASWWPLRSHSVSQERATECSLEGRVGGRIFETDDDGVQHEWGRVLTWEPPDRLTFDWHPGRDETTAQEVEVRFEPGSGTTTVTLTHTGWEAAGEGAPDMRRDYDEGWDLVLGRFVVTAENE